MQAQLSQIMIFGRTFSKSKLLFQILPLNRKLLLGNSFCRTHHAFPSTCKSRLMIRSILLTTRRTLSTRFFTRSTRFSIRSTRFSTCSTRFSTRGTRLFTRSTRLSACSICLSTCNICLSTRSTLGTICRPFYH